MTPHPPHSSTGALVAHILPYPSVGGTEHGTLRVMKAVESFGFRSLAINLHQSKELRSLFEDSGFPVLEWPAPEPSLRRGVAFWRASRALAGEMKRRGVDLVHCSDYLAGYHASLAGYLTGAPVLCHIRNRHEGLSRRDRIFLSPVKHFAFVSKDTWNRFPCRVGPNRGSVIYDGVAVPGFLDIEAGARAAGEVKAEFGLPSSSVLIGMIARVAPQKDYPTLIRAAATVVRSYPDARFLIIGDNSMTEATQEHFTFVRQLLCDAGLTNYFIFTGYRSDTSRLLSSLDISVLSTHHEGLPLALIEAMAWAKPVVATAVDGVPELIEDGLSGFLTPHENAGALADKINFLLGDPAKVRAMGEAARRRILDRFTVDSFSRSMDRLYKELLSKQPGRSAHQ